MGALRDVGLFDSNELLEIASQVNPSWIVVDGEEDLLTLPAILFAPPNSLVLYGHWQHGIIAVEVDEEMKEKIWKIIERFT